MTQTKSKISEELTDLGYQTSQQKRGLVKWINSTLSVLLFLSVTGNFVQWKFQLDREDKHFEENKKMQEKVDKLNDKYNDIFLKMIETQKRTVNAIDTIKSK